VNKAASKNPGVPGAGKRPKGMGEKIMKTQTIEIREKITGKTINIEGDMIAGMRACVARNRALRASNMGGEWALSMAFHLSPDEYEKAIEHWSKS
jgi:hypothetical protein